MYRMTLCFVFAVVAPAVAQEPSEAVREFAEVIADRAAQRAERHVDQMDLWEAEIEKLREGVIDRSLRGVREPRSRGEKYVFGSSAMQKQAIKEAEDRLADQRSRVEAILDGEDTEYPLLQYPGAVGDAGLVVMVHCSEIIDESSVLAKFHWSEESTPTDVKSTYALIQGIDTKGVVEGKTLRLRQVLIVVEKRQVKTETGMLPIFVLEPLDLEYVARMVRTSVQSVVPFKPKNPMRTWTSSDGNFTVEARLLGISPEGAVRLEKADGTTVEVPKSKLSKADNDLLRSP